MARAEMMEYIREYIKATDDGEFESSDDLEQFVIDQLFDQFGEDLSEMVAQAMRDREV